MGFLLRRRTREVDSVMTDLREALEAFMANSPENYYVPVAGRDYTEADWCPHCSVRHEYHLERHLDDCPYAKGRAALAALSAPATVGEVVADAVWLKRRTKDTGVVLKGAERTRFLEFVRFVEKYVAPQPSPGWDEALQAAAKVAEEHARRAVSHDAQVMSGIIEAAIRALRPGGAEKSAAVKQVGLDWKLSDDAKARLAEIDAAIVKPGDPRLNQIIGGPSEPARDGGEA